MLSSLAAGPNAAALALLTAVHALLTERILPHEKAEETQLYPALAGPLGSGAIPKSIPSARWVATSHEPLASMAAWPVLKPLPPSTTA